MQKTLADVSQICFSKPSPKTLHKRVTSSQNNVEERKPNTPEHVRRHVEAGTFGIGSTGEFVGNSKESPSKRSFCEDMKISHQNPMKSSPDSGRTTPITQKLLPTAGTEHGIRREAIPYDTQTLVKVLEMQHQMHGMLNELVAKVSTIQRSQAETRSPERVPDSAEGPGGVRLFGDWTLVIIVLVFQTVLQWFFSR